MGDISSNLISIIPILITLFMYYIISIHDAYIRTHVLPIYEYTSKERRLTYTSRAYPAKYYKKQYEFANVNDSFAASISQYTHTHTSNSYLIYFGN